MSDLPHTLYTQSLLLKYPVYNEYLLLGHPVYWLYFWDTLYIVT